MKTIIRSLWVTLVIAAFGGFGIGLNSNNLATPLAAHAAPPSQSTFNFVNPCNGDIVLITATVHITGNGAIILSDARGVDLTTGVTYHVSYEYGVGGAHAFVVNLHLVGPNGGYSEHDLFLFDANGFVTRVVENTSCS